MLLTSNRDSTLSLRRNSMGELKIEGRALIVQEGNVVTVTTEGKTTKYRSDAQNQFMVEPGPAPLPPTDPVPLSDIP